MQILFGHSVGATKLKRKFATYIREAAKKVPPLMAWALRPYLSSLMANFFSHFFLNSRKRISPHNFWTKCQILQQTCEKNYDFVNRKHNLTGIRRP